MGRVLRVKLRKLTMTCTCPYTLINRVHRAEAQRAIVCARTISVFTCACLSARSKLISDNRPAISPDPETSAYSATVGARLWLARCGESLTPTSNYQQPSLPQPLLLSGALPYHRSALIARKRASVTRLGLLSLSHRCGWLLMPFCPWPAYSEIRRLSLLPCRSSL